MTTSALPPNADYFVAAYVVLLALVLVYVVVMAARIARSERALSALHPLVDATPQKEDRPPPVRTGSSTPPAGVGR